MRRVLLLVLLMASSAVAGDVDAIVRGVEAFCIALDTGSERWVLWDPTGYAAGQRVRVVGFIDPFASFCGITPLLHNISIEALD